MRARLLIVGVRHAKLQTERGRIVGIDVVQVSVLTGMLRGLSRACRGVGGAGGVPLSRIGQAETMVVSDGVVHADAVLVVDAVAAVAGLVFVGNALVTQRMVGFVLHLSVTAAVGVSVRQVHA